MIWSKPETAHDLRRSHSFSEKKRFKRPSHEQFEWNLDQREQTKFQNQVQMWNTYKKSWMISNCSVTDTWEVRSAGWQKWEAVVSDDLLQITWTHTNRIVLSKSRPDRSCLSPYSCHMDSRLVTHTPHTHMFSVLLSRSLNMMRVAVFGWRVLTTVSLLRWAEATFFLTVRCYCKLQDGEKIYM